MADTFVEESNLAQNILCCAKFWAKKIYHLQYIETVPDALIASSRPSRKSRIARRSAAEAAGKRVSLRRSRAKRQSS